METKKIARIIFAAGLVLTAEINGNSYIVDEKPDFPDDFTRITVETEDGTAVIEDGELIECSSSDGRYWFNIREVPDNVKWRAEIEDALCELSKE